MRGGGAADGGLHHRVDVTHVQAVARQLVAIGSDGQAGLAQFTHHGDLGNAGNLVEDVLHLSGLLLQRLQVLAENLHGQSALESGFGLIYGVFGGLRVVENHTGKRGELLLYGLDQLRLGVNSPVQDLSE